MPFSFSAGLSSMGSSLASTAQAMVLEKQRDSLETRKIQLANDLATQREHTARVETGAPEDVALKRLGVQEAQQRHALVYGNDAGTSPADNATTAPVSTSQNSEGASSNIAPTAPLDQIVPTGNAKTPVTFKSLLPPGMSEETARVMAITDPKGWSDLITKWHEPQKTRQNETISYYDPVQKKQVTVYRNTNEIKPFSVEDRQNFGLSPNDKGYIDESGKPVLLKPDEHLVQVGDGKGATVWRKESEAEGQPGPPNASTTQLSQEAINDGAWYFIQNNKMPGSMRDRASVAAIQNKIAELKPEGMASQDWMRVLQNNAIALHGKTAAAGQTAKVQAGTAVNEDTVVNSINILNGLLKKGVAGPTGIVSLNDAAQYLKRQFNDADAANLKNAVSTLSGEYARVMTGQTSGGASSDSSRAEAAQRLLLGYNKGTMQAVSGQLVAEMRGRSRAYENAMNQLTGGTYSGVTPGEEYQPPEAPASGASIPSAPTATGPNGQKIILKNGQWAPLQ